ncbi:methyltransferase domain-containing protein [bacterium]|nr:methyltransferase domain-containing protein [bacterium]
MNQTEFNTSYIGRRDDVLAFVPLNAKKILDIGCSDGTLGASIKEIIDAQVVGIELSEQMADSARKKIDRVFTGDVEKILFDGEFKGLSFDTIILADIIEHLVDPWKILNKIKDYLEPGGKIIVSLPNIRHIDTIFHLVFKGYWPYRDRGIHDRTHLRFFTKKNIFELFEKSGLLIERINTNYRIIEAPHRYNRFAKFFAFPGLRNFLAFQYIIQSRLK